MSNLDNQDRAALAPAEGRKATHNVPPLVWIVIVVLVALAALAYYGRGKNWITPHGGSTPATASSNAPPASGS